MCTPYPRYRNSRYRTLVTVPLLPYRRYRTVVTVPSLPYPRYRTLEHQSPVDGEHRREHAHKLLVARPESLADHPRSLRRQTIANLTKFKGYKTLLHQGFTGVDRRLC